MIAFNVHSIRAVSYTAEWCWFFSWRKMPKSAGHHAGITCWSRCLIL